MWKKIVSVFVIVCTVVVHNQIPELETLGSVQLGAKTIFISNHTENWINAHHFCTKRGLRLLTITSAEQQNLLKEYIHKNEIEVHFWTGGIDLGSEGQWYWISPGTSFTYNNWKGDEPTNSMFTTCEDEDCLLIIDLDTDDLAWNDVTCSVKIRFICETN